jgi:hypothetical protein
MIPVTKPEGRRLVAAVLSRDQRQRRLHCLQSLRHRSREDRGMRAPCSNILSLRLRHAGATRRPLGVD